MSAPARAQLSGWRRWLPFLEWAPAWREPGTVRADLLAWLTGAIVVLPQGLAFATLAGLPPQHGLYAAMVPCLVAVMTGFALLAVGGSRTMFVVSALVFGTGFGSAYPLFLGHVMRHVEPARRGAAFGSIIAAFDTGIGTGSMTIGWIVQHYGYRSAFGAAAALALLTVPYFLTVEPKVLPPGTPVHS